MIENYRVVPRNVSKEVTGIQFTGYGSHVNNYPLTYLNAAAAIGMVETEIDVFMVRLSNAFKAFQKKTNFPQES